jgi:hypothetical protein
MNIKTIFLFLLVIFSLKFFDAVIANTGILKNICYGVMFLTILMSLPYFFRSGGGFILPVQLICISIVISVFMAKYTWGQGFEYSVSTIPYLIWIAFFLLLKLDIPIRTIENIALIYGIIYIVLFLFQFTHTDVVYFGMHDEFREDRGIVRVNFPGGGVFFLSCFIAINKVTSNVKYRFLWLTYALAGIVIIVLQVTRQAIIVMLLIYLIHFLKNVKLQYKIGTIILFIAVSYAFLNSENPISKGLAQQQKEDASAGGNYIRILETEYFLGQFTPNTISKVLGNGFFNETSNYGKVMISLSDNYGFYLSDVGLVEVYILFGVFAIIAFIIIFIKSITIPLPGNYYYLKYYLWMILLTSLTSDFLISYYFVITTVLVLYCYQRLYEQHKLNELISLEASNINEIFYRNTGI